MFVQSVSEAASGSETTCVVAVVGFSDVGKTTLLELLIPRLCGRGLVVGAVKHASHGFDADRPGKDSHRIYQSGASAVTLVSRNQLATFRRREVGDVSLYEALAAMPTGLDLVLAEGFAWELVPRFALVRAGEIPAPEHVKAGPVLAIVEVAEPVHGAAPVFEPDIVEALVDQLEDYVTALRLTGTQNPIDICKPPPDVSMELAREGVRWRPTM